MKYTKVGEVDFGDYDPDGIAVSGYVTEVVKRDDIFGQAIVRLVLKEMGREYGNPPEVLMTTRSHWSGYSEYTITNEWSEIALTVPAWNWEHEWPSLGDFLRAMGAANPEADR